MKTLLVVIVALLSWAGLAQAQPISVPWQEFGAHRVPYEWAPKVGFARYTASQANFYNNTGSLQIDTEVSHHRVTYAYPIGPLIGVAQTRVVGLTGGFLDEFLENFHDAIGYADGRERYPRNLVQIWDNISNRWTDEYWSLDSTCVGLRVPLFEFYSLAFDLRLPVDSLAPGFGVSFTNEISVREDWFSFDFAVGIALFTNAKMLEAYDMENWSNYGIAAIGLHAGDFSIILQEQWVSPVLHKWHEGALTEWSFTTTLGIRMHFEDFLDVEVSITENGWLNGFWAAPDVAFNLTVTVKSLD